MNIKSLLSASTCWPMTFCMAVMMTFTANAQSLISGGQFMDLLLPMEGSEPATSSDWGTTAGENTQYSGTWTGTLGRWKDNGIEDTQRSYWGGNIIKGDDGRYHIYVAGWQSATCGHMAWSSKSRVYHVVSDNVWGPYRYVSDLGSGHNPEIYKTGDTYVIYPGPRSSVRWERFIEGVEQAEKVRILREEYTKNGDSEALKKLNEAVEAFKSGNLTLAEPASKVVNQLENIVNK